MNIRGTPVIPLSLIDFALHALQNHDAAHDINHALAVYDRAVNIINLEGYNLSPYECKVLPYIMIGHDFRDHKIKDCAMSAAEIYEFYCKELSPEDANMITYMHDNCSWTKRDTSRPYYRNDWLRLLLQDADWLEALGEGGLQRCIAYTAATGGTTADVCKHIREKLLLIPRRLNNLSAVCIGEALLGPLHKYLVDNVYDDVTDNE